VSKHSVLARLELMKKRRGGSRKKQSPGGTSLEEDDDRDDDRNDDGDEAQEEQQQEQQQQQQDVRFPSVRSRVSSFSFAQFDPGPCLVSFGLPSQCRARGLPSQSLVPTRARAESAGCLQCLVPLLPSMRMSQGRTWSPTGLHTVHHPWGRDAWPRSHASTRFLGPRLSVCLVPIIARSSPSSPLLNHVALSLPTPSRYHQDNLDLLQNIDLDREVRHLNVDSCACHR
jgi:hypothetical protein